MSEVLAATTTTKTADEPRAAHPGRLARAQRRADFLLDHLRLFAVAARAVFQHHSLPVSIATSVSELKDVEALSRLIPDKKINHPTFRHETSPQVSIVVPIYNHLEQTMRCLRSIAATGAECSFELIVVDDGSTDGSADWLLDCLNVRLHRMGSNSGFVAACNAGAAQARGEYLVFLNNDTTVTAHWLDALMTTFSSEPRCGLVGAKLVYPDGRLREAGAIVFDEGNVCNYGRGGDPQDSRYDFVREVDFCSGACIAIAKTLFDAVDGFDARYVPTYYEDADLAFSVRKAGYRVIYQPRAELIHYEGQTAGVDVRSGVKSFQSVNREKFAAKWQAVLPGQPAAVDFARRPASCATHRGGRRVLIVDAGYPHADRDSGSLRMLNMVILLRELGCHVLFWAQNTTGESAHSRTLEDHGIELVPASSRRQALRWWYEQGAELDMVVASRLPVALASMRLIRRYATNATVIFDTVDLHFLRISRGAAIHLSKKEAIWADELRERELGLMRQADLTLVVSEYEQQLLRQLAPGVEVKVLSTIHAVHGRQADFLNRAGVLFLGNFEHDPNVDAARWLIECVMPLLRIRLPGVCLHIVGYAANDALAAFAADDVLIHGYVADLAPVLGGTRLALAPLRYGAGVKGKINMAMSYGVPIITTTVGAEGMDLLDRRDAMIADDAQSFADAIAEAHEDEKLWMRLSDGGLENVRRLFSPDVARTVLKDILRTASA